MRGLCPQGWKYKRKSRFDSSNLSAAQTKTMSPTWPRRFCRARAESSSFIRFLAFFLPIKTARGGECLFGPGAPTAWNEAKTPDGKEHISTGRRLEGKAKGEGLISSVKWCKSSLNQDKPVNIWSIIFVAIYNALTSSFGLPGLFNCVWHFCIC